MGYVDFRDQVVVVTGASSGIGAAAAVGFAEAGASVALHYHRNEDGAKHTVGAVQTAGGTASLHQADLADPASADAFVEEVLARHGRIDVLVNNAGDLVNRSPVADVPDEEFHRILDVNLTSVFALSRRIVPVFKAQGGGSIINVTSIAGRTGGAGGSVVYATSKGAVSTFTRGLAKELAPDGIRVNAIAPGVIKTPFHDRHTGEDQLRAMLATIPMGRTGTPHECVGTILFLASERMSSYVTGQIIEVNGGQLTP
ncbi:SDR family NAD(P)-dependent oxidoreductase [Kribbella solani]|uniref:3-oxoacyl-[acyl-carrier protein] reductase n=2 Tax=Kribbella solani TaxID=236067 RepID=A0A841DXV0_9ACTN|nr:SDR family NAD(P)-dependent oxidoreductase [Kribbella solani]MBB5981606.1 3-oxoacyl-[acyl-carrier protein] reductase [Kribbella solani]MDX3001589.1 SDR family NAD(P)-dependent oxidoreductase [Kribbella solani]